MKKFYFTTKSGEELEVPLSMIQQLISFGKARPEDFDVEEVPDEVPQVQTQDPEQNAQEQMQSILKTAPYFAGGALGLGALPSAMALNAMTGGNPIVSDTSSNLPALEDVYNLAGMAMPFTKSAVEEYGISPRSIGTGILEAGSYGLGGFGPRVGEMLASKVAVPYISKALGLGADVATNLGAVKGLEAMSGEDIGTGGEAMYAGMPLVSRAIGAGSNALGGSQVQKAKENLYGVLWPTASYTKGLNPVTPDASMDLLLGYNAIPTNAGSEAEALTALNKKRLSELAIKRDEKNALANASPEKINTNEIFYGVGQSLGNDRWNPTKDLQLNVVDDYFGKVGLKPGDELSIKEATELYTELNNLAGTFEDMSDAVSAQAYRNMAMTVRGLIEQKAPEVKKAMSAMAPEMALGVGDRDLIRNRSVSPVVVNPRNITGSQKILRPFERSAVGAQRRYNFGNELIANSPLLRNAIEAAKTPIIGNGLYPIED